jgi:hypothetical protein
MSKHSEWFRGRKQLADDEIDTVLGLHRSIREQRRLNVNMGLSPKHSDEGVIDGTE